MDNKMRESIKMKYYDPATRKRPEFKQMMKNYGRGSVVCMCSKIIHEREEVFEHWQQGHFDTYEEYKERKGFDYDSLKKVE